MKKEEAGFAAWTGGAMEDGENSVKRSQRNIFGDVLGLLSGVATDGQLQQQLRVDEELKTRWQTP